MQIGRLGEAFVFFGHMLLTLLFVVLAGSYLALFVWHIWRSTS